MIYFIVESSSSDGGVGSSAPNTGTHSLSALTGITRATPHSLSMLNRNLGVNDGDHEALPEEEFSNPSVTFRPDIAEKIEDTSEDNRE